MEQISDIRSKDKFTKFTFSNYKKTDVLKELLKSLKDEKREEGCYWSAELICGGNILELWEIVILYLSKYIHIGNPKLPIYISNCVDKFKKIMNDNYIGDDLAIRNNNSFRQLFCEIIVILIESSRKTPLCESNKVSQLDFDVSNIGSKLKAPNINYIKPLFKEGDTKEVYIALNELYYNISDEKNNVMACYWIEWLIEFDIRTRKQKKKYLCERRSYIPVKQEDQINIIWIIWDVFFDIAKTNMDKKILNSLLNIFCLRFSKGIPKKRKFIFYYIISLFTERVNYNTSLIKDITIVNKIKENINKIYKEIKKNEISPKVDYLLIDPKKSNKEKSIEKLKIMDTISFMR